MNYLKSIKRVKQERAISRMWCRGRGIFNQFTILFYILVAFLVEENLVLVQDFLGSLFPRRVFHLTRMFLSPYPWLTAWITLKAIERVKVSGKRNRNQLFADYLRLFLVLVLVSIAPSVLSYIVSPFHYGVGSGWVSDLVINMIIYAIISPSIVYMIWVIHYPSSRFYKTFFFSLLTIVFLVNLSFWLEMRIMIVLKCEYHFPTLFDGVPEELTLYRIFALLICALPLILLCMRRSNNAQKKNRSVPEEIGGR